MLDLTNEAIIDRVRESIDNAKGYLEPTREIRRMYVGNKYRTGEGPGHEQPENRPASWVARIIGAVASANPRVWIRSRKGASGAAEAKLRELALNVWIRQTNFVAQELLACIDCMFGFAVWLIGMKDDSVAARYGEQIDNRKSRQLPAAVRLAPERFFWDQEAEAPEACRLQGHQYQMDYDDALKVPFFDAAVIQEMGPDDTTMPETGFARAKKNGRQKRITLWDVYVPEQRAIMTVSPQAHSKGYIRKPTAFDGSRRGPYVWSGIYPVPGQPVPLSPMAQAFEQLDNKDRHERAAAKEASSLRRGVIVGSANPEIEAKIMKMGINSITLIPGFTKEMLAQVDLGGTSPARLQYNQMLDDRLDRQMGDSATYSGAMEKSNVTATQIQTTQGNADSKTSFIEGQFTGSLVDVLTRVAVNLTKNPTVSLPIEFPTNDAGMDERITEQAGAAGIAPEQIGIAYAGGENDDFERDYELQIEPNSTRRVDPAIEGQRVMQNFDLIVSRVIPAMQQYPWLKWEDLLDDLGQGLNIPDLSERVMQQQQAMAPGAMPGQMPPQAGPMGNQGQINPVMATV